MELSERMNGFLLNPSPTGRGVGRGGGTESYYPRPRHYCDSGSEPGMTSRRKFLWISFFPLPLGEGVRRTGEGGTRHCEALAEAIQPFESEEWGVKWQLLFLLNNSPFTHTNPSPEFLSSPRFAKKFFPLPQGARVNPKIPPNPTFAKWASFFPLFTKLKTIEISWLKPLESTPKFKEPL